MTFSARSVLAGAASVLLLAPAVAVLVLLVRDLRHAPPARVPVAAVGDVDVLVPGRSFEVWLTPTHRAYRALVLTPRVEGGTAELGVRICSTEDACVSAVRVVSDRDPLRLPLPSRLRGGQVRVSVVSASGPAVSVQRWATGPAVQALVGYSWSLPLERAREFWHAYTASSGLGVALLLHAVVVFAGIASSVRMSCRRDGDSRQTDA